MTDIKNILIVDDHQILIDGVKSLLRKEQKFKIAAEALSAKSALEILESNKFDILISDVSMPEMDGVELTKIVKQTYPDLKVLVLTMYNNQEIANELIMSEAEGFILKNTGKKELVAALESIAEGGTYYSQEILAKVMQAIKTEKKAKEELVCLTDRELEVLQLICEEYSSEQIADKLCISKRTVDTHRQHIYEKTKCKTIISLIKYAIRNNLASI